jgi:hypothetical protein
MSDDAVNRDFEAIDDAPLREPEIKQLRLLLEQDRARRRFVQKLRRYSGWVTFGLASLVAGNQIGFLDWLAGLIIRWRH